MPELAVEPPVLRFTHHEEERLLAALTATDTYTLLQPIHALQDILLNSEAQITIARQPYRLTRWALFQLCQLLSPGLYNFIVDLAGTHRQLEEPRDDFSFSEAVETLNRLIRRRFRSRLCGKMFLRNSAMSTIDGILGAGYRWLSNLELYHKTQVALTQSASPYVFAEGALYGRWVLVRYLNPKTYCVLARPDAGHDNFYAGYHFSNNEVGKAAIRAAAILQRKRGGTASLLMAARKWKLHHVGGSFDERVTELIKGTFDRLQPAVYYQDRLAQLQARSLGMGNKDGKQEEAARDNLVAKLVRYKLPLHLARRVIGSLAYHGSYQDTIVTPALFCPVDRTAFDLYNTLGREALILPINQRERLEHVAYSLLIGRGNSF